MELIDSSNLKFNELRNIVLSESDANPIYASDFINYYNEYFNKTIKSKIEFVVLSHGVPVILFLIHEYDNYNSETGQLSYYGLPGLIAVNARADIDAKEFAFLQALTHLREIGALKKFRSNPFALVYPDPYSNKIDSFEELIALSTSARVYFEKVIDTSKDKGELLKNCSKSVKSAIKSSNNIETNFMFTDSKASETSRRQAIRDLKELHYLSAGRNTRSDKSWDIQASLLESGSVVIGTGYSNGKIIHGAMFMLANKKAFYAVSANSKELAGTAGSHPFIFNSILALKDIGIEKVYMGRQFEELTRHISEKERNIAKFKSFFGGNLLMGIGLSNNEE
jgi:hypothetical protein